ncbi:hypothetical protein B0H11DRAFT_1903043 [Mycena galericulata]|nr:hypothetical protein B0H11DRAFT_1903043 [Mycena galericulata]
MNGRTGVRGAEVKGHKDGTRSGTRSQKVRNERARGAQGPCVGRGMDGVSHQGKGTERAGGRRSGCAGRVATDGQNGQRTSRRAGVGASRGCGGRDGRSVGVRRTERVVRVARRVGGAGAWRAERGTRTLIGTTLGGRRKKRAGRAQRAFRAGHNECAGAGRRTHSSHIQLGDGGRKHHSKRGKERGGRQPHATRALCHVSVPAACVTRLAALRHTLSHIAPHVSVRPADCVPRGRGATSPVPVGGGASSGAMSARTAHPKVGNGVEAPVGGRKQQKGRYKCAESVASVREEQAGWGELSAPPGGRKQPEKSGQWSVKRFRMQQ